MACTCSSQRRFNSPVSSIHKAVDQWQLLLNEHVMMGEPREKGTNKSLIRVLTVSSHCLLSVLCCAALFSQHRQQQSAPAGAAECCKSSMTWRILSFERRCTQTCFQLNWKLSSEQSLKKKKKKSAPRAVCFFLIFLNCFFLFLLLQYQSYILIPV